MKATILTIFLCVGVVDRVENEIASVQVTTSEQNIYDLEVPTSLFPCEIGEGDSFYFAYSTAQLKFGVKND